MKQSIALLLFLLILSSCSKEETDTMYTITRAKINGDMVNQYGGYLKSIAATDTVYNIKAYEAFAEGGVAFISSTEILEYGHCWSQISPPVYNNGDLASHHGSYSGTEPFEFTSSLTGLDRITTYFLRSYVITASDTGYNSTTIQFTTKEPHDYWIEVSSLGGTARENASAFVIGDYGYIGLGDDGLLYRSDFFRYSFSADTWEQVSTFTSGKLSNPRRSGAVAFSLNNYGYVGMGSDGQENYNDLWRFDPDGNIWSEMPSCPGHKRKDAAFFTIGSKAYIGTGYGSFDAVSDFYVFDSETETWQARQEFAGPLRSGAKGFSIGDRGFFAFGERNGLYYNDLWEYNSINNEWIQKTSCTGAARSKGVAFSISYTDENNISYNYGFVGMGYDGNAVFKDMYRYDKEKDSWIQLADFYGDARFNACSMIYHGAAYIGLGYNGTQKMKDFWKYLP